MSEDDETKDYNMPRRYAVLCTQPYYPSVEYFDSPEEARKCYEDQRDNLPPVGNYNRGSIVLADLTFIGSCGADVEVPSRPVEPSAPVAIAPDNREERMYTVPRDPHIVALVRELKRLRAQSIAKGPP